MPASGTRPFRLTHYSSELATNVRRGIGYEGYCACGWQGPLRKEHDDARRDCNRHQFDEHFNRGQISDGEAESATGRAEAS